MKKPKQIKSQQDIIRFMGRFPDKIIEDGKSIFDKGGFICTECGGSKDDIPRGEPCGCGSISWIKPKQN